MPEETCYQGPSNLSSRYRSIRATTERLSAPLTAEDQTVQSMGDCSPTKWHRAHVTWLFETFILEPHFPEYEQFEESFGYIFNSYYEALGKRHPRCERGLLSRPGVEEISRYRQYVDNAMDSLMCVELDAELADLVSLGLHHEQQHQELLLMDIKHAFACNPVRPAYVAPVRKTKCPTPPPSADWIDHQGGIVEMGHAGHGFGFDNEFPRHNVYLQPFSLADRPVTCGDWLSFMEDGGYQRSEFWSSDGWAMASTEHWTAPLYWLAESPTSSEWRQFTLSGEQRVCIDEPVCHISFHEAQAFAKWSGLRLPTEAEWETIATELGEGTDVMQEVAPHPRPAVTTNALYGDVWEWTSSSYAPYPGFRAAPGAVGEYNGKFMVSQYVLRGGSCATPPGHARSTYRNFFPPASRWSFSGLRLARDI